MFQRDNVRIGILATLPGDNFRLLNATRGIYCSVFIVCLSCLFPGCKPAPLPQTHQAGPVETLRISSFKGELAALVWFADSEGLFTKHGLQAQVTGFDSGLAAVEALMAGNEDVATAAETVFVNKSLAPGNDVNLKILGEIARSESIAIVARLDRGIASVADLKGKKIALTSQTPSAYFLDRHLLYNHIDPGSVTIVNLPPLKLVEAVVQGSVDAAITWEPYVWNAQQKLASNGRSWPAQSDQQFHFLLICAAGFVEKRPEAVKKLFRALSDAEAQLAADPARARQVLARRLAFDERYLATVWTKHTIGLSLDQTLLVAMEDQARWAIARGLTPASRPPNYLKSIEPGPLVSVRPDAVTLYR